MESKNKKRMKRTVSACDVYLDMLIEIEQYLEDVELKSFCFAEIGRVYLNTFLIKKFLSDNDGIDNDCLAEMKELVELIEVMLDERHSHEFESDSIKNILISYNALESRFKLTQISLCPLEDNERAFKQQIRIDQDMILFSPGLRAKIDDVLSM